MYWMVEGTVKHGQWEEVECSECGSIKEEYQCKTSDVKYITETDSRKRAVAEFQEQVRKKDGVDFIDWAKGPRVIEAPPEFVNRFVKAPELFHIAPETTLQLKRRMKHKESMLIAQIAANKEQV